MNKIYLVAVSKKIVNVLVLALVLAISALVFSGVNISRAEPAPLPAPGVTCDPTVPGSCPSSTPGAKNSQPSTSTSVNTNIPAGCPGGPAGPKAPGVDCSSGDEKIEAGQEVKGTCQQIKDDGHIISDGWISALCTGGADQTAIESIIENLTNYVLGLGMIAFGIMLGLGMVQVMVGGSSPEALKAGKKRIFLAASSIGLFFAGRMILDLIGVTGNHRFLNVPIEEFNQGTVGDIIGAIWNYIKFFGGALSVTMIIAGGIKMMTATGNPQQIQAARKTITYAIIGLLGVLSVELITGLIGKMITG